MGRGVAEHCRRAGLQPGSPDFAGREKGAARKINALKEKSREERGSRHGEGLCLRNRGISVPPRLRARLQRRRRERGGLRRLPEGPGWAGLGEGLRFGAILWDLRVYVCREKGICWTVISAIAGEWGGMEGERLEAAFSPKSPGNEPGLRNSFPIPRPKIFGEL